ncbi:MAG: LLM class F420-dependent oxidoreductase, partial [Dehalococcoidia bacterium]|nr:LLM class F420-dependent oxidoreductase [Dehalococcoidia bacterium]
KYGFILPNRGSLGTPENTVTIAKRAEEMGYDSLFKGDHIVVPGNINSRYPYTATGEFPGSDSGEAQEMLAVLSFLAGQTRTIRLVTSVIIVPHRNPLVAAKALATLDVLSNGRLVVGIGAGWMREEFEALDLPPFEERGAVTDEYVRAFKELWTSETPTFEGKYCRFSDITFLPKPVQKPHPPIWVGGESPRALRRTAELADGWYPLGANPNFPLEKPEQLAAAISRLASYAEKAGRDPSDIEIIHWIPRYDLNKDGEALSNGERLPFTGSADQIASDIRRYEEMGVGHLVVDFFRAKSGIGLEEGLQSMEDMATQVWPLV